MKIGVDATCWLLPRGFGRHARCLLTALRQIDTVNEYEFFTDAPDAVAALEAIAPVRLVRTSAPTLTAAAANGRRAVGDLVAMSRAMSDRSIDVLLFPTVYSYVPVWSRARKVILFHDVTAERFPDLTLDSRRARWFWRAKIALARRQAHVIGTVSDYSRALLARQFRIDAARVQVVGEAADPVFRRLGQPRPTARLIGIGVTGARRAIVYVGGFSPHKNLRELVDAFDRLAVESSYADVDLILVGGFENETFFTCYQEIRDRVRERGLDERVRFAGFLPDEDLVTLLNLADVLVLPSKMEGFGLPAVEAAACGCPVIATTESPLPGLLGDAGVFVDPFDPAALERALVLVLSSAERRETMRRAGLVASAKLTWTAAARDLLGLMTRAVSP
jgi:glycosyltransferase involved in cell wall biosynthesis